MARFLNHFVIKNAVIWDVSPILITLMMEVIRSFETSVLTRTKGCHIQDYEILLTEITTTDRNIKMFLGSRARPVCDADNLIVICEPIV
jgi:hypothetical protein